MILQYNVGLSPGLSQFNICKAYTVACTCPTISSKHIKEAYSISMYTTFKKKSNMWVITFIIAIKYHWENRLWRITHIFGPAHIFILFILVSGFFATPEKNLLKFLAFRSCEYARTLTKGARACWGYGAERPNWGFTRKMQSRAVPGALPNSGCHKLQNPRASPWLPG